MTSRQPQGWDCSGAEHGRPGDRTHQTTDASRMPYGHHSASGDGFPTMASTARASAQDGSHRRSQSQQRLTRRLSLSNPSDRSDASVSSTKASSGRSSPPSTNTQASSSSQHKTSLQNHPPRPVLTAVRPADHSAPAAVRPQHGPDQYGFERSHSSAKATLRHPMPSVPSASSSQPSIFSNPHGIREVSAPPRMSSSRPRPTSMVIPPTFEAVPSNPNDMGLPGFMGAQHRQPQMPGAFPSDFPVPYRRPVGPTTQLSNESTDRFASNSDSWDSEGDTSSNLSTSTNATTVASDITVGKDETYAPPPRQTSSGTATPTQSRYDEPESHPRLVIRPPQAQAPAPVPQSILRRAGNRSVPSVGSGKTIASSAVTKPSSSGSSSRQGGAPSIHIEVHGPESRRNSQSDARMRQKIEEVLKDKIDLLRAEHGKDIMPTSTSTKQNLGVRFAEPEQHTKRLERSAPAPVATPEKEDRRSRDLTHQSKEIQKLESEIEQHDLLIKERQRLDEERKQQEDRARREREKLDQEKKQQEERARKEREKQDQERKQQEERARAEREKERERARQNLEIEKREAQKAEQLEREKKQQRLEREKKENERAEKAQKAQEEKRAKERQQLENDKKAIEQERLRIENAQKEHEKLQASFIDQGKILEDLRIRFDDQSKTLETTAVERDELREVKAQFEKKCKDLSKNLAHVSDKERYVVEQVASLQIIRETLQKRVGPLEERVATMATELGELHSQRDGLMKDTKAYLDRITDAERELKGLIEEKRGLISQVSDLQKENSLLKDEVKQLQETASSLETNIEARAKDYSEHIATLRTDHAAELDATTASLNGAHEVKVAEFRDKIADLNEHIDGAHEHVERFKGEVAILESQLAEEKSKSDALSAERDSLSIDLGGHRLLAVDQETTMIQLREDIARRSDAIARLQETNKTLQAEREELQKLADASKTPEEAKPAGETEGAEEAKPVDEVKPAGEVQADDGAKPAAEKDGPPTNPISEEKDAGTQNEELATAKTALEEKRAELDKITASKAELEARIAEVEAERTAAADAKSALESKNAELEGLITTTKTELEARIAEAEAQRTAATDALITEQTQKAELEAAAAKVPALEGEKAALREQLDAANKLIEGLTAANQAGLSVNTNAAAAAAAAAAATTEPALTPLSPTFPESPRMGPQQRKVRSRAPSMVRSVSTRSNSTRKSGGGAKDDIALVLVRNPGDRGNVTVVRKCDLRAPRSRSQPPEKDE